jgi:CRP/FNR family transcriptional regulator, anaerobic regulatory protein
MFTRIKAYYKALAPGITETDWEALQSRLEIRQMKKGEYLVRAGQVCDDVAFINKGMVRVFLIKDGREVVQGLIDENNYISEYASFLTRQPSVVYIEMLEDGEVILLHYKAMQELYIAHPIFERVGRKIAEDLFLHFFHQTILASTLTPEERYLRLRAEQSLLLEKVPQYMIASYLGITPEHLSRIRRKLTAKKESV